MAVRHPQRAYPVALGGVLAAVAVVIMNLGTVIPVATYACPTLCAMILEVVRRICGSRIGWAWFGAVAVLTVLLAPDKEAAAVFVFWGSYPLIKPWMDKMVFKCLWKLLYFNFLAVSMYWVLINIFMMEGLNQEFAELGKYGGLILLVMGNGLFFLLDILLSRNFRRMR